MIGNLSADFPLYGSSRSCTHTVLAQYSVHSLAQVPSDRVAGEPLLGAAVLGVVLTQYTHQHSLSTPAALTQYSLPQVPSDRVAGEPLLGAAVLGVVLTQYTHQYSLSTHSVHSRSTHLVLSPAGTQ